MLKISLIILPRCCCCCWSGAGAGPLIVPEHKPFDTLPAEQLASGVGEAEAAHLQLRLAVLLGGLFTGWTVEQPVALGPREEAFEDAPIRHLTLHRAELFALLNAGGHTGWQQVDAGVGVTI